MKLATNHAAVATGFQPRPSRPARFTNRAADRCRLWFGPYDNPLSIASEIRGAVREIDPPLLNLRLFDDYVSEAFAQRRRMLALAARALRIDPVVALRFE